MAQVIAWRFDRSEKRFILKFSDRRRVKIKTIKAILNMDEVVQMAILPLGVPMADDCERTQKVIRRLKRKFTADDDDDDIDNTGLPTVSSWSLDEKIRKVKVTYKHGFEYSLSMEEMLKIERLRLLEQFYDLAHSNDTRSRVVMIFKYRLQQRRDDVMALYANAQHDDECEESDEQSDGYISAVIPYTEDY